MPSSISSPIYFTLYSRSYCHLCDDMLAALRALDGAQHFAIEVVDVDGEADLQALYDELVPVLFARTEHRPAERLCHYFLDEKAVQRFIASLP
jgi:hypothetical protein